MNLFVTLLIYCYISCISAVVGVSGVVEDLSKISHVDSSDDVLAYPYKHSESKRYKRDCRQYAYGDKTSSTFPAHGITVNREKMVVVENLTLPLVEVAITNVAVNQNSFNERDVQVHIAYVNNPVKTVSVYEPLHDGTCKEENVTKATVMESIEQRECLLAINAGFFNTENGACYGNIVSDGKLVGDSKGIQNAHFGIMKTGQLFFGYLSEIDIVKDDFIQLVGGVIWVLRDGEVYVDESIASECRDTEETGSLQRFASVVSARTLVGHDDEGRVMVFQADGKTNRFGVNLYEAASIMRDLGAINAINVDGGGSSTYIINNTIVNHPSDRCGKFQCARQVSTVLCVHEPYCKSKDCGGNGDCDLGVCHCHGYWKGDSCDILGCPGDCAGHGVCTEDGCVCLPGYRGNDCSISCTDGWYGNQCEQLCMCENNATCDSVMGKCFCRPGYTGPLCQYRCTLGFYGEECSNACDCEDSCLCDPELGTCNYTYTEEDYLHAGACFTKKLEHNREIEFDMLQQYKSAIVTVAITSIVTFVSVTLNIVLLCKYCTTCPSRQTKVNYKRAKSSNGSMYLFGEKPYSSFTSSTPTDGNDETSLIETQPS